ncbi:MAG: hypothetical protein BXU00_02955 [Candidatus Nanoclepta minutus]|uniref:Uncharacterized protein n=1 Tax=Candidatus Nanoclepta minutus TaxID=1940235 RepID=A0A397WM11_9ARCH|nr:MAG: hypothetical protein BXU00_02955 [Candidatus Nanoclepta minutus]
MALGFLKRSKKKEDEEMDFLEELESTKKDLLEPELPEMKVLEKKIEPLQLQPLPAPSIEQPVQLPKAENKVEEKESPEIYVKLDNYKKVLDLLDKLKVKLKEIESLVGELRSVKESEVSKLEEIKERLEKSKEDIGEVLENLK